MESRSHTPPSGSNKWIKRVQPQTHPRVQLYCLAHAGGGASTFRPWANGLPADIQVNAVQLPGHEERLMEPPLDQATAIADALADVIVPELVGPCALFGYSMGALVAFELARELRRRQVAPPVRLFAAAMRAPQIPPATPNLHALPEQEFLAEVNRRYEAVPEEVVQEPELLSLLLPPLRADMAVCDTYDYTEEAPLACPITVLAGEGDPNVSKEQLDGWQAQTSDPVQVTWFPGDHFFMRSQLDDVLAAVAQGLEEVRA